MSDKPKLCIAIPAYDAFRCETVASLVQTCCSLPYAFEFKLRRGTYLHRLREELMQDAIDMQATHTMFIDTDVLYDPADIQRLLDSDKDIIGANYHTKEIPPHGTIKMWGDNGRFKLEPNFKPPPEPFKCAVVPTGFMLINMKKLLRSPFKRPFFDFSRWPDGEFIGEDVHFCLEAQKAGLEVWCDPRVIVGHVGLFVY